MGDATWEDKDFALLDVNVFWFVLFPNLEAHITSYHVKQFLFDHIVSVSAKKRILSSWR